jgi:hypothetical protein
MDLDIFPPNHPILFRSNACIYGNHDDIQQNFIDIESWYLYQSRLINSNGGGVGGGVSGVSGGVSGVSGGVGGGVGCGSHNKI